MNEIAKFNKLAPKYTLTGEEGPPHHKTFTVTLELGPGEKYEGSGTSIKKVNYFLFLRKKQPFLGSALGCKESNRKLPDVRKTEVQAQATETDKLRYCLRKAQVLNLLCSDALTPTVKLNGLAMKRGEMVHYKMVDRKPIFHNNQSFNPQVRII